MWAWFWSWYSAWNELYKKNSFFLYGQIATLNHRLEIGNVVLQYAGTCKNIRTLSNRPSGRLRRSIWRRPRLICGLITVAPLYCTVYRTQRGTVLREATTADNRRDLSHFDLLRRSLGRFESVRMFLWVPAYCRTTFPGSNRWLGVAICPYRKKLLFFKVRSRIKSQAYQPQNQAHMF